MKNEMVAFGVPSVLIKRSLSLPLTHRHTQSYFLLFMQSVALTFGCRTRNAACCLSCGQNVGFCLTKKPLKAPQRVKKLSLSLSSIVSLRGQHAGLSLDWQLQSSNVLWHKR